MKEIFSKLEVYYLANKSENLLCLALGDCSVSEISHEAFDDEIIETGLYEAERLNTKYKEKIFNFAYRKRIWSNQEKCYMGWERKRGLLTELNSFLTGRKGRKTFIVNTLDKDLKIKYVITLDSDTELTLNSGIELIQAMAHPLNTPIVSDGRVVSRTSELCSQGLELI